MMPLTTINPTAGAHQLRPWEYYYYYYYYYY
jgi:hypothetical protein